MCKLENNRGKKVVRIAYGKVRRKSTENGVWRMKYGEWSEERVRDSVKGRPESSLQYWKYNNDLLCH